MGKNFSSRKLFACSNKSCPNRSHYTPACPNVTRKETGTSSAASTLPALSVNVNSAKNVKQGEGAGKMGGSVGKVFDRFAMMVEETEESFPTVLPDGTQEWKNRAGELHRSGDQPAIVRVDGAQMWYREGLLHRDNDLPARIYADGRKDWWHNGKLHRSGDRPARIYADGRKDWWHNGKLHRSGDRPARIYADGRKYWYLYGKLHRDNDLPARVLASGIQEWRQHDKMHRVLGPAFLRPDGYQEWWFRGEQTEHPDLCEQACVPAQTEDEKTQLFLLCFHDDPVVAAVAAHNPDCPEEGTIAYNLKRA